jgi:haloalkane dehalogenase
MDVLRTPDSCFSNLPDFPFAPHYADIEQAGTKLRIHYLDEGPAGADPALLMHGEPSWCFLYRKIVTRLAAKGHRAIAPDLVGFGRSDKPSAPEDYTYERHVDWMRQWLFKLDLTRITLFCQDWGGLIGLRLVAAFPERFARVIVANTGLPVGQGFSDAFQQWLKFSQSVPELPIDQIVNGGTSRELTAGELAAYRAPFPGEAYKVAARRFPLIVPITPEHGSVKENLEAWKNLERFEKPFLTAFSDGDPITRGGERVFQERVPGAKGQKHVTIQGGGHFLQEDKPLEIADLIDRFMAGTP